MKKIKNVFLSAFLCGAFFTYAQVTVENNGATTINANVPAWGSGLKVVVPNSESCAYHLSYGGKDRFYVCALGWLWTQQGTYVGSDLRLKKNVKQIPSAMNSVKKLNGIQFDYIDSQENQGQRLGFVAQEVEAVLPGLVKTMPDGNKAVAYTDLIALLLEAVKEQQVEIDVLKAKKDKREGFETIESVTASLEQNIPNPFSEKTQINYYLPETVQKAELYIYDMNGKQLKNISISEKGQSSVSINGAELKAGMYYYTLIADGKEVDTKRMILTK